MDYNLKYAPPQERIYLEDTPENNKDELSRAWHAAITILDQAVKRVPVPRLELINKAIDYYLDEQLENMSDHVEAAEKTCKFLEKEGVIGPLSGQEFVHRYGGCLQKVMDAYIRQKGVKKTKFMDKEGNTDPMASNIPHRFTLEECQKFIEEHLGTPHYYTQQNSENSQDVIDMLRHQVSFEEYKGFLKGNVLKYVIRADEKGGTDDLGKAAHYLMLLAAAEEHKEEKKNRKL